jgi:protein-disulfide isomerase
VTDADHVQGVSSAGVTFVEYGDYECSYCGEAFVIVHELQRVFTDSLRFVFRNFPLANVHPHAERAAEVAEAVAVQGHFWALHDLIYEHQEDLSDEALLIYAERVGADIGRVAKLIEGGGPSGRVQRDLESGLRSGVNGTPAFFVNGRRYDGSWDYETLSEHLRRVLQGVASG